MKISWRKKQKITESRNRENIIQTRGEEEKRRNNFEQDREEEKEEDTTENDPQQ